MSFEQNSNSKSLPQNSQRFNLNELLLTAARDGDYNQVESLLRRSDGSIDINAHDNNTGETPLHKAIWHGYLEVTNLLLVSNADVNSKDNDGWTPLHVASCFGHADIVKLLLVNYHADVNSINESGWRPLHCASFDGHTEIVQLLLSHNAAVNSKNNDGQTPLSCACNINGNVDIVQLLIDHHESIVNMQENCGRTCLHTACYCGQTDIVKLLLRNGAISRIKTVNNETALDLARTRHHNDIIDCFEQFQLEIRQKAFDWLKVQETRTFLIDAAPV